jgi:hypothetical protein
MSGNLRVFLKDCLAKINLTSDPNVLKASEDGFEIMKRMINDPRKKSHVLIDEFKCQFGNLPKIKVKNYMNDLNWDEYEKRNTMLADYHRKSKELIETFRVEKTNLENLKHHIYVIEHWLSRDLNSKLIFVFFIGNIQKDCIDEHDLIKFKQFSFDNIKRFWEVLIEYYQAHIDIIIGKSNTDRKSESRKARVRSNNSTRGEKSTVNQFVGVLKSSEIEKKLLNEKIEQLSQKHQDSELLQTFAQSGVLEYFFLTNELRKEKRVNNIEIPEEWVSAILSIKKFLDVLEEFGVMRVYDVNETLDILESEVSAFDFQNKDFDVKFDENIKQKKIKIISPGWKYRDAWLMLPKAVEFFE